MHNYRDSEQFYLKKKKEQKNNKNTYLLIQQEKKKVQNITPALNITPSLKTVTSFSRCTSCYFWQHWVTLCLSKGWRKTRTGLLKVESDQELTSRELRGAPVLVVIPFVGHSGEDSFHISSGCWDARDVADDRQHTRQVSYLKESHPPGSHTFGLPFIFSIFIELKLNSMLTLWMRLSLVVTL